MKKTILVLVLLSIVLAATVYAQEPESQVINQAPTEIYYINVSIDKIYSYRMGFVVVFESDMYNLQRVYIPREWFIGLGNMAEMVTIRAGREWPSMTIFYNRGEFSHVRLRVRENTHQTWGIVPPGVNLDDHFNDTINVNELRLQF